MAHHDQGVLWHTQVYAEPEHTAAEQLVVDQGQTRHEEDQLGGEDQAREDIRRVLHLHHHPAGGGPLQPVRRQSGQPGGHRGLLAGGRTFGRCTPARSQGSDGAAWVLRPDRCGLRFSQTSIQIQSVF